MIVGIRTGLYSIKYSTAFLQLHPMHAVRTSTLGGLYVLNASLDISVSKFCCNFLSRVSDAGLTAIAEGCPLRKLNLCGCQLITDNGLTAIARGCPDLVYLDISVLRVHHLSHWISFMKNYLKIVVSVNKAYYGPRS